MKILLVAPYKSSFLGLAKFPPLGLGYLATSLRNKGYEVKILDCLKEGIDSCGYRERLLKEKPDVLGVNSWSCSVKEVKEILEITKKINPEIITLVGGPHPSAVPPETMDFFSQADFGFKGEAEIGFPLLVDMLFNKQRRNLRQIPGLIWKENKHWKVNQQVYYEALDDFGYPSWDLIRPGEYAQWGTITSGSTAPIITTRGCPYFCTFCSPHIVSGRKLRFRSTEHIIKEIKLLKETYGIKKIAIMDENFTLNKKHALSLCKSIIDEKLNLNFFLPNGVRLDSLDEELLLLMRKAGFISNIAVGIESGSERILKMIRKNLSKEKVKIKMDLLKRAGFKPIGYFILGFPTETKEEMYETLQFAKELKLYRAAFSPLLILPATQIYDDLKRNGQLPSNYDFSQLVTDSITYVPSGMTIKDFAHIHKDIVWKFNSQIRVIFDYMRDWNSFIFALLKFRSIFLRRENFNALS